MLLPDWLATSKTICLPKNNLTHEAKNYRLIVCQNITYEIYTGIIRGKGQRPFFGGHSQIHVATSFFHDFQSK